MSEARGAWIVNDREGETSAVECQVGEPLPLTEGDGWAISPYPNGELITVVSGPPILRGTAKQVKGWQGLLLIAQPVTITKNVGTYAHLGF